MTDIKQQRVVCWFSCGVTSAVATKLCLKKYPDAIIAYCDTGSEHPDNARFIKDCEAWFGRPIQILKSSTYADIWDVFTKTRWLVGPKGARCTTELKKLVRRDFELPGDLQIFGFDKSEIARGERFRANNIDVTAWFPLIEEELSKNECLELLQAAGIELPAMYHLGYRNNNCIGCVKGGIGYWNKIRKDFPEVFDRMAKMERELGVAILKDRTGGTSKKMYLDELPPGIGRYEDLEITCGLFCGEI